MVAGVATWPAERKGEDEWDRRCLYTHRERQRGLAVGEDLGKGSGGEGDKPRWEKWENRRLVG